MGEINSAVIQLDQVTQQNAAMFEETTAASQALSRSAQSLNHTTVQFQTHETKVAQGHSTWASAERMRAGADLCEPERYARSEGALALETRAEVVSDDWEDF